MITTIIIIFKCCVDIYACFDIFALLLIRPFIFNLLVYETGDRIFSKSGKKIKIQIAGFYFCRWSKKHEYEKM